MQYLREHIQIDSPPEKTWDVATSPLATWSPIRKSSEYSRDGSLVRITESVVAADGTPVEYTLFGEVVGRNDGLRRMQYHWFGLLLPGGVLVQPLSMTETWDVIEDGAGSVFVLGMELADDFSAASVARLGPGPTVEMLRGLKAACER
jgi:Polyketide cyclase / dehydrase and lipid transport